MKATFHTFTAHERRADWGRERRWLHPRRFGLLVGLVLFSGAQRARAFEKQWHTGGGLGLAAFDDPETALGPGLGVYAAYGLSDMFDARLELIASRHERAGSSFRLLGAATGLSYKIDVSSWIPYVGLALGYYHFSGDTRPATSQQDEFGISVDFGVDYVWSSSLALGLQIRLHGDPTTLHLESALPFLSVQGTKLLTGLLRAEYHWGG